MTTFQNPTDIANRALQHVGGTRIAAGALATEASKNAREINFNYDKLRKAELRRNIWRFSIRKATLYPLGPTTYQLVPAAYNAAKTYILGSIVTDTDGVIYVARQNVPISTQPSLNPTSWHVYFGTMTVIPWDSTGATRYQSGDLVYYPLSAPTSVYMCLNTGTLDTPGVAPAFSSTVTYNIGDTVTQSSTVYQSVVDLNVGSTPPSANWQTVPGTQPTQRTGQNWLKLDSTIKSIQFIYPAGAGPNTQSSTRNVFMLPNAFLREAPPDPKGGNTNFLGFPSNFRIDDYYFFGNFFSSEQAGPISFRFAADIFDVTQMDEMFCEGFACRIALETNICLTENLPKLTAAGQAYTKFMGEARLVNAIEIGEEQPPLDDFIACRY